MPEEKELVCVNCPKGCRIIVTMEDKKILSIKGYSCENGKQYAEEEMICPMRVLTTTIKINGAPLRVLPVMSNGPIPLERMEEAMEEVRKIHVDAPVKMNQVVVSHFLGTDVDLIASRSMSKKKLRIF